MSMFSSIKILRPCIALLAGLIALSLIYFGYSYWKNSTKPDQFRCAQNITGKLVFVVDGNSILSPQTRYAIEARAVEILDHGALPGELISIFATSGPFDTAIRPLFSYCKQSPREKDFSDRLMENIGNYKSDFEAPFVNSIRFAMAAKGDQQITQVITQISTSDYLAHPTNARLIVFSDLMNVGEQFSFAECGDKRNFISDFRKLPGGFNTRPTFDNVRVEVNVAPYPVRTLQSIKCRNIFWNWFFGDNQGSSASFDNTYLPG